MSMFKPVHSLFEMFPLCLLVLGTSGRLPDLLKGPGHGPAPDAPSPLLHQVVKHLSVADDGADRWRHLVLNYSFKFRTSEKKEPVCHTFTRST